MTYLEQIKKNLETIENFQTNGFVVSFEYFLTLSYKDGATSISGSYEPQTIDKRQAEALAKRVKNGKGEVPTVVPFETWKQDCINDLEEMIEEYSYTSAEVRNDDCIIER